MQIELIKIKDTKKYELKFMLLEYLKEIFVLKFENQSSIDEIDYTYLDLYWQETTRIPLFIKLNNEVIGFVLINNWIVCKEFRAEKTIAEFYVKPKYRRQGVGKNVAFKLFKKYKGKWEIRQSSTNLQAINFWREIIGEFTQGIFKEIENKEKDETEVIQLFES